MTLTEFLREERQSLVAFSNMWLNENKRDREHFPMELEPGDWWDQFLAYETSDTKDL